MVASYVEDHLCYPAIRRLLNLEIVVCGALDLFTNDVAGEINGLSASHAPYPDLAGLDNLKFFEQELFKVKAVKKLPEPVEQQLLPVPPFGLDLNFLSLLDLLRSVMMSNRASPALAKSSISFLPRTLIPMSAVWSINS